MNDKVIDRIAAHLEEDRVGVVGADVARGPGPGFTEGGFEDAYQKIGWWKGPNATPEARALVSDFWRQRGEQGLRWLVGRLRREWHLDLLDGVASLLARAGDAAIPPILDELERQPARDQAEALLKAFGWMGEQGTEAQPSSVTRLELALSEFLHQEDPGLREWATRAAGLLPRERAVDLLRRQLVAVRDPEVRKAIEETVAAIETR
jgi:hypothetical protein